MTNLSTQMNVAYFGKIPSRGDFVKSGNLPLVSSLDNWLARAMDSMTEDSRWKNIYDLVKPFHFAFLGPKSKLTIAGHFLASADAAHRRFPFVAACTMEVDDPDAFTGRSPLVLSRLWNRLSKLTVDVAASESPDKSLHVLSESTMQVDLGSNSYDANFADFLEIQTIGSLDEQLQSTGFKGNCRHMILGLGLLLQPVMVSGANMLEKSLCLPLPSDPMHQYLTAAFWLGLISSFLQRADFELSIYIISMNRGAALVVGFNGASSLTLQAILNPAIASEHFIGFDHAAWVEESVASDYGVTKLASYLEQSRLSLAAAKEHFNEVFLGG